MLIGADGRQTALTIEKQVSPDTLSADSKGMKRGSYILRWQVLATDGHITRGQVPFQVQ
jgi:methionine-rich copper-binding protein CopC